MLQPFWNLTPHTAYHRFAPGTAAVRVRTYWQSCEMSESQTIPLGVQGHGACSHNFARSRPQPWTGTTAKAPHKAFELPDRVNNLFAIILLFFMEWGLYLHVERHDWDGAAARRTHPKPRNHRKQLTSNLVCERKLQRRASRTRQSTSSVHAMFVVMDWGARNLPLHLPLHQIMREPTSPSRYKQLRTSLSRE